jgi:hypothetical protein
MSKYIFNACVVFIQIGQLIKTVHLENYLFVYVSKGSLGSSGSIVSDYGLDDQSSIPDRGRGFFF